MLEDQIAKATPMMKQYLAIKSEYQDCLLLYRMGDFYELFYNDAIIASRELELVLTKRGKTESGDIPMCGVPFHAYENYLARLIKKGYKVAICEQTESPEQARKDRGTGAVVNREVVRIITQGTLVDDNLLSQDNNFLCALNKNTIAWIDISTGEFNVKTLRETPMDFLIRLNPSEIILSDSAGFSDEIKSIRDFFKKKITTLPESKFASHLSQEIILKTFNISDITSVGIFSNEEIIAVGIILQYLKITNKADIKNIKIPSRDTDKSFLEIDAFSFANLEIIESINGQKGKGTSLFSVIDKTRTSNGRRLLKSWLKSPIRDLIEINSRLSTIEFFEKNRDIKRVIQEIITNIPDVERSVARLSLQRGGPRDIENILRFIQIIPELKINFNKFKMEKNIDSTGKLEILIKSIKDFSELQAYLSSAIKDENLPLLTRDGNFIREGFDINLDKYISLMRDNKSIIATLQSHYVNITNTSSLKIKFNNVLGYFIELPSKQAQALFDNNEVFIHRQTNATVVRFSTTELAELETNIREAESKKHSLELELFEKIVNNILKYINEIREASTNIALIDVFTSLSELAIEEGYSKPKLTDSAGFSIKGGRHPVVEFNLKQGLKNKFIPNDCTLNGTNKENSKIWILTGPNMAGKSTFLRQNALIAVLAHIGSYVPADHAEIGILDKIFSRVGASDNLAKGQSTFMVEMIETALILNKATDKSLVILDEIGRGTSTFDGFSIAWAVMEYLNSKCQCHCLFATHYHELTELSESLNLVSNHTMTIKEWNGEVIFMHKVEQGTADKSYGIHVAKIAGLPASIIKRAQDILESLEKDGKSNNAKIISQNLSLFDDYIKEDAGAEIIRKEDIKAKRIADAINIIDPNELSPKEALSKLYEIKALLDEN